MSLSIQQQMGCLDISAMHESTFYEFCLEPLLFQQFFPFLTPKNYANGTQSLFAGSKGSKNDHETI